MTNDTPDDARRRAISQLLATTTNDPERRLDELQTLRRSFHDELAVAVQPVLNTLLRLKDVEDIESRRELCGWANAQLRLLGLAVKDRDGRPSILVTDTRDADDSVGRYRLEHRNAAGHAVRTASSSALPDLTLMADPPRTEPFARGFRPKPKDDRSR